MEQYIDKLYIIVRKDISAGDILAQACHCAIEFSLEHHLITKSWHDISNYIVILEIQNEIELINLIQKASDKKINFSLFREPDMDNQITAIALAPGIDSKKLCSNLSLAFKKIGEIE